MKSAWFTGELIKRERGIGAGDQSNVRTTEVPFSVLKTIEVDVPSSRDQLVIADYLDRETARIDTLIEEQQRLIEGFRERRIGVLAVATSQGERTALRRVLASLRQGFSPNCDNFPADGVHSWGVLKVGCANSGSFQPSENKSLPLDEVPRREFAIQPGEIIMSRSNTKELVGAAAVVDGNYPRLLLSDLTYGLTVNKDVSPAYVAFALQAPEARSQISVSSKGMSYSMQKISQSDIRDLVIRLPGLDAQLEAVSYLERETAKIDALIAETQRFIELSKERRAALITAAVTGQIDVREAS